MDGLLYLKTCVEYQYTLYVATSGFYVIIIIIVANWPCHAHGGLKIWGYNFSLAILHNLLKSSM